MGRRRQRSSACDEGGEEVGITGAPVFVEGLKGGTQQVLGVGVWVGKE